MRKISESAIIVIRHQVGDRATIIPKKAVCLLGAADDASGQGGQERIEGITAQALKGLGKAWRPVLRSRLPAVGVHGVKCREEFRAGAIQDGCHVGIPMVLERVTAHRIGLQPLRPCRRSVIRGAAAGMAEAHDHPITRGDIPLELAFGIQAAGQINDTRRIDHLIGGRRGGVERRNS